MEPLYHAIQQTSTIPNTPGIYLITCIPTKKIYVGSAVDLRHRYYSHFANLRRNEHKNPKLQNAWNKYGRDAFTFEILEYILFPELLTDREQYWFKRLHPFGKSGFNIAVIAGSTLGTKRSDESRARMSVAQRGNTNTRGHKFTPEHLEQHRLARIGKKQTPEHIRNAAQTRIGKKHSEETREKMRIARRNQPPPSEETCKKISEANKRRIISDESKAKMSATGKSRVRPSEEYASRRKDLILTSPDGAEHFVHGIHPFCVEHGLDSSAIAKVARGIYKHHKGWTARFLETI